MWFQGPTNIHFIPIFYERDTIVILVLANERLYSNTCNANNIKGMYNSPLNLCKL